MDQGKTGTADVPSFGGFLNALSVSSYVAAKFQSASTTSAQVVSILRGCVNWATAEGELFCLLSRGAGNLPHGIVADAPEGLGDLGLTVGSPVVTTPTTIRFGSCGIQVDLTTARLWSPSLIAVPSAAWPPECVGKAAAVLAADAGPRGLGHLLPRVGDLASGHALADGGEPIEARSRAALLALSAAIRDRDGAAFAAAAGRLVGMGVGLTPSGDDVLLGALCALMLRAGPAAGEPWFAEPVRALPDRIRGRTTQVSETLLAHAASRRFPERLMDLLWAFVVGDVEAAEQAAHRLKTFGSSSGREMVLGALLAAAASDAADSARSGDNGSNSRARGGR